MISAGSLARSVWRPKPDLMPLTGGYRKTPVMQVGADIYCDTQLIMLELERRLPSPPFQLKGREGEARAITMWIDRNMFAPAVGLVMSQIDVAGKFGAGFARDRSDFSGRNFDPERLRAVLPVVRDQAYGQLSLAEAMLADGRRFVLGAEPSMPDCALYNPVWFNRRASHVRLPPKDLTDLLHARNRRHCATTGVMHHNGGYPMMFDPRNARHEFEKFLSGRNLNERNLNLANGCETFFDFYRDLRPRGRVPSSVGVISLGQGRPFEQHWDSDRLLFQWNIYDWGAGENFYLNLSRNLVLADDDAENEPTWQLRLTVEFEQSNDLRADKWAGPLSELPDFRAYVIPGIHNLQQASNPSDDNPSI